MTHVDHRADGSWWREPASYPWDAIPLSGQTKRHSPCFPAIGRTIKRPRRNLADLPKEEALGLVANLIRLEWYCSQLRDHPAFRWASANKLEIPEIEFALTDGI